MFKNLEASNLLLIFTNISLNIIKKILSLKLFISFKFLVEGSLLIKLLG